VLFEILKDQNAHVCISFLFVKILLYIENWRLKMHSTSTLMDLLYHVNSLKEL